jgi:serine/threonine protein kinase
VPKAPLFGLDTAAHEHERIVVLMAAGIFAIGALPLFLFTPDGRLVLIDFGLTVPDKPAFLQPGNRVGTPNYMAPEVVRRRQADKRLDIFSFGITAYEICTGQSPWPKGSSGKAAMAHDTPPNDIREGWPEIPSPLAPPPGRAAVDSVPAEAGRASVRAPGTGGTDGMTNPRLPRTSGLPRGGRRQPARLPPEVGGW